MTESERGEHKPDSKDVNITDETPSAANMKAVSKSHESLSNIIPPTTDCNCSETVTNFCFSNDEITDSKNSRKVEIQSDGTDEVCSSNLELSNLEAQKFRSDDHLQVLCCKVCDKVYKHRQSLQRHMNKEHPMETSMQTSCKMECQEKSCKFTCRFLYQLRKHLKDSHNFQFNFVSKTFSSYLGMLNKYVYLRIL